MTDALTFESRHNDVWPPDRPITPTMKKLLYFLHDSADQEGAFTISARRLASVTETNYRLTVRSLRRLQNAGYLDIEQFPADERGNRPNTYRVVRVTPDLAKVAKLGRKLGLSNHDARVLVNVLEAHVFGDSDKLPRTPELIAEYLGWQGDPEQLMGALLAEAFLREEGNSVKLIS